MMLHRRASQSASGVVRASVLTLTRRVAVSHRPRRPGIDHRREGSGRRWIELFVAATPDANNVGYGAVADARVPNGA